MVDPRDLYRCKIYLAGFSKMLLKKNVIEIYMSRIELCRKDLLAIF